MNQFVSERMSSVRSFRFQNLKDRIFGNRYYNRTTNFIQSRPMTSFFVSLLVLFGIIALASFAARKPAEQIAEDRSAKAVKVYTLGTSPTVTLQAEVEKTGVVQLVAQTAGVVQKIKAEPGQSVVKGEKLIILSSNYQGGNAPAIQTSIAQAQYKNTLATYQTQKDLITKQREVAQKTDENTTALQDISQSSIDETRNLLDLNKQNVQTVIRGIQTLEANPPGPGYTGPSIETLRGTQSQIQSGINQLETALANLEYSTNKENPPTELARLQKEIALKGLDVQERALELQKKVSGLQVNLVAIGESVMYPSTPFTGTVERILVRIGQSVSPGTALAVVKSQDISVNLTATAPQHIAQSVSTLTPSTLHIQNTTLSLTPQHIATEATNGQLYALQYSLPEEYSSTVTDGEFIQIDIPLTSETTVSGTPYIPIDAVFQTQQDAYVTVAENGVAQMRKITLGTVYGEYVEVISGIKAGDKVILDRNVLTGDRVAIQ